MSVNTSKVAGRRTLAIRSLDELMTEAENVVHHPCQVLGNWTLGQILQHLAQGINAGYEKVDFPVPWFARTFIAPFIKNRMLTKKMPAGFKLPEAATQLKPDANTTPEEGLEMLRVACEKLKTTIPTQTHPFFGKMAHQEWVLLMVRHAELHLSFVIPQD